MILNIQRLVPEAVMPVRATEGSACFDLCTLEGGAIRAGEAQMFRTGLAVEMPSYCVMLLFSRSGHGAKYNLRLANCVGVIDSDYRGEIMVSLYNDSNVMRNIAAGESIAQAMIVELPFCHIKEVTTLTKTARGEGGFGSTGKAVRRVTALS